MFLCKNRVNGTLQISPLAGSSSWAGILSHKGDGPSNTGMCALEASSGEYKRWAMKELDPWGRCIADLPTFSKHKAPHAVPGLANKPRSLSKLSSGCALWGSLMRLP